MTIAPLWDIQGATRLEDFLQSYQDLYFLVGQLNPSA